MDAFPLFRFLKHHREVCTTNSSRQNYSSKYVAISHAWKDGLGNTRGNALPQCQVEKILQKIKETSPSHNRQQSPDIFRFWRRKAPEPPVSVWMDTLCIPVDDDDLRMKAIKRMTPTYKSAEKMMVIDSSLNDTFAEKASTEFCADLLISAWNGRCWTLQEGALAQELCFPASVCSATPLSTSKSAFGFFVDLFKLLGGYRHHATSCLSPPANASNAEIYIHRQLHEGHQLPSVGRWGKVSEMELTVYCRLHYLRQYHRRFHPQFHPRFNYC
jgi:hypothetical protein